MRPEPPLQIWGGPGARLVFQVGASGNIWTQQADWAGSSEQHPLEGEAAGSTGSICD